MLKTLLLAISIMTLTVSCLDKKGGGAGSADIKTDEGKFSYAVGHEIGKNMKRQGVKLHYGSFIAGV